MATGILLSRDGVRLTFGFHPTLRCVKRGAERFSNSTWNNDVAALFAGIPASYFWGYICDKTRRYKAYILLSFLSLSAILFAFTLVRSITLFVILYVVMQMLHVAHESPKNILIAEHYSRDDWEKSYAHYEGLTEIGWFLGLFPGLLAAVFSLSSHYTLLLCGGLNLVAFILSIFLVADPILIFERRLVGIEKKIDFTYRGIGAASQMIDGFRPTDELNQESFLAFGIALVFFTLASGMFFHAFTRVFPRSTRFSRNTGLCRLHAQFSRLYDRLFCCRSTFQGFRRQSSDAPNRISQSCPSVFARCRNSVGFCHDRFLPE